MFEVLVLTAEADMTRAYEIAQAVEGARALVVPCRPGADALLPGQDVAVIGLWSGALHAAGLEDLFIQSLLAVEGRAVAAALDETPFPQLPAGVRRLNVGPTDREIGASALERLRQHREAQTVAQAPSTAAPPPPSRDGLLAMSVGGASLSAALLAGALLTVYQPPPKWRAPPAPVVAPAVRPAPALQTAAAAVAPAPSGPDIRPLPTLTFSPQPVVGIAPGAPVAAGPSGAAAAPAAAGPAAPAAPAVVPAASASHGAP